MDSGIRSIFSWPNTAIETRCPSPQAVIAHLCVGEVKLGAVWRNSPPISYCCLSHPCETCFLILLTWCPPNTWFYILLTPSFTLSLPCTSSPLKPTSDLISPFYFLLARFFSLGFSSQMVCVFLWPPPALLPPWMGFRCSWLPSALPSVILPACLCVLFPPTPNNEASSGAHVSISGPSFSSMLTSAYRKSYFLYIPASVISLRWNLWFCSPKCVPNPLALLFLLVAFLMPFCLC